MSHGSLERNQIRRRLDDVLRTDSDLNAFCLDYFPEVHRRFAGGMERSDKVNLLLQLAPKPDMILSKLGAYSSPLRTNSLFPQVLLPLAIAVTIALAAGLYLRFLRHTAPSSEDLTAPTRASAAGMARSPVAAVDANSGNVIDRSPNAEMHNRARLPAKKTSAFINSNNRIQGSCGAKMDNRVMVIP